MSEKIKETFCQPTYERALLSYCFETISNYFIIGAAVSDKDFLRPEHRFIWVIMGSLAKKGASKFDVSMIVHDAQQNGVLKEIGGYEYVMAVTSMDVTEGNIQFYIDKVLDASTKYQLYMKLNYGLKKMGDQASKDDVSAADMIGMVGKDVMDLSLKSKSIKEATNLADGLDEYIEERKDSPVEFCGLSSGYDIFDKRIDGLVPGTLTVICARPKGGKSAFLSNIGSYVAYELGKPVLYVDTEMPFGQWRDRILAMMSGVPERRIKHGGYSDNEYERIQIAARLIKKGKFFHEYMPGYSVDKLVSIYKKYKYVEDIGLAIFDYIKAPSGVDFRDKREYQVLGDVTTALKDMSGELDIPFLCANQINRQDDVADSDRILRYADVLMFFKPKTNEELDKVKSFEREYGNYKLIITNSRRGGTTPEEGIGYVFMKRMLRIEEAPKQLIDYDSKDYQEKEEIEHDFGDSDEWGDESAS
jgi:replicative DNA helicase